MRFPKLAMFSLGRQLSCSGGANCKNFRNRASTYAKNLIVGTPYIEHVGEVKIMNHKTEEYAVLDLALRHHLISGRL